VHHLPPFRIQCAEFSMLFPVTGFCVATSRLLASLVAVNHLQSRGVANRDQARGPSEAPSCLYVAGTGGKYEEPARYRVNSP